MTREEVAPLAGSVDRNCRAGCSLPGTGVAPLAGSVDRNPAATPPRMCRPTSLPSRGAWIEIPA